MQTAFLTARSASWFVRGLLLAAALVWASPGEGAEAGATQFNELTAAEKADGWKLLFDGKTTAGWRSYKKTTFPEKGWVVEDGCLKHTASGGGGDIITSEAFDDFELRFQWRIAPGANSGLKYLVPEDRSSPLGHEYQLIDDQTLGAGERGGKGSTGSFYAVLPPTTPAKPNPPGQFNESRILIHGNHVEHWLNGTKILEYELGSDAVKAGVAASKFKNVPGFGSKLKGHLLLQDHGGEACFRGVKLRPLPAAK